jgi:hypothetical protein
MPPTPTEISATAILRPYRLIQVDATEDYDQFSQEIRIASPTGGKFEYIAGFYYHQSDLDYRSIEGFGTSLASPLLGSPAALTPNLTRDYAMTQDQDMWAIFGSGTYSFTDRTRLTLGLRYFDESKTASHVLDKRFTGGWDYSPAIGAPAGTLTYGDHRCRLRPLPHGLRRHAPYGDFRGHLRRAPGDLRAQHRRPQARRAGRQLDRHPGAGSG